MKKLFLFFTLFFIFLIPSYSIYKIHKYSLDHYVYVPETKSYIFCVSIKERSTLCFNFLSSGIRIAQLREDIALSFNYLFNNIIIHENLVYGDGYVDDQPVTLIIDRKNRQLQLIINGKYYTQYRISREEFDIITTYYKLPKS